MKLFIPSSCMKVELSGQKQELVPVFIKTSAGVKFVIEEEGTDGLIARLAYPSPENQHIDLVKDKDKFLGAGTVKRGGDQIEYLSLSCVKALGRDCPADRKMAEELIEELRTAIKSMLQQR